MFKGWKVRDGILVLLKPWGQVVEAGFSENIQAVFLFVGPCSVLVGVRQHGY